MRLRIPTRTLPGLLGLALALTVAGPAAAADITSTGPLTRINITADLNCQVTRSDDTQPEFYGGFPGACGTFVSSGGTLYGPASVPAGIGGSPPYTPVSQSAVTGSGTAASPYRVVTVVDLGTSGIRLTETDTYVTGDEFYRTDVQLSKTGTPGVAATVYRAGDCYLQNSDDGFGRVDGTAISCVAAADPTDPGAGPGTRIEQFQPLTAGSSYLHDFYGSVWQAIATQSPFPNQCNQCNVFQDNGAGLSWNVSVPGGGSTTVSSLITFSPTGVQPLRMVGKGAMTGSPGGAGSYAYILRCASANTNAPFEVRFGSQRFRLTSASNVTCTDNPSIPTPTIGFDTQTGTGSGTLTTGGPGTIQWTFVDGGTSGASDSAQITIRNSGGTVIFQGSSGPPGQFPGSTQGTGNNTAQAVPSSGGPTAARR